MYAREEARGKRFLFIYRATELKPGNLVGQTPTDFWQFQGRHKLKNFFFDNIIRILIGVVGVWLFIRHRLSFNLDRFFFARSFVRFGFVFSHPNRSRIEKTNRLNNFQLLGTRRLTF